MNILVLQSELGVLRGGGENFTRNLFAAFAERGHRIVAAFVANRAGFYPLNLPLAIQPVPIKGWWSINFGQRTLAAVGRFLPHGTRLRSKWDYLQEAVSWRTMRWHGRRFQRRVETEFVHRWSDFDAIYVHSDTVLASKVANYRPTLLRLPGPVTAELEPLLRRVDAVCANGDALLQIRTFLGDHATELPIGIDINAFNPNSPSVRYDLGWTDEHKVIGYVGRLMHLKGTDILVSAFRRLLRTNPNVRLLIVGSGPEETHIRPQLAKELSNGVVRIEPDIDHDKLSRWYRAMDVLVMPSRYENFSNALLEGMACGIPFAASDVGGNRLLERSGAGWLFTSESESSLASLLSAILQDPRELKRRGQLGSNYVRTHCSWSVTAEKLEQILSSRLGVC